MADVQSNALDESSPEAPQTAESVPANGASTSEATMDESQSTDGASAEGTADAAADPSSAPAGEAQADSLTEAAIIEEVILEEAISEDEVITEALVTEPAPPQPVPPQPVKTVEAAMASAVPELESTTIVPGTGADETSAEGGGEWELLLGKVRAWLGQGKLQAIWAQARNPLTLILAIAALLVVLRVYSALLGAIDSLPLIPGLLELVGVIWVVRIGVPKLLQRSKREELFGGIQQRWQSFRGRG